MGSPNAFDVNACHSSYVFYDIVQMVLGMFDWMHACMHACMHVCRHACYASVLAGACYASVMVRVMACLVGNPPIRSGYELLTMC